MRTYHALSRPRYYRDRAGDFFIVVGVWKEDGQVSRFDGAASVVIGQARHVIGWEFDVAYVRRCRRVTADAVPAQWHQSLDRYIDSEVISCV